MLGPVAALCACATAPAQNYALEFNGDRQAVLVPDYAGIRPTGNFTVEAWIKPYEPTAGSIFKFILSKNYAGQGFALVMVGLGSEQRIQFESVAVVAYGVGQGYNEAAFRNTWMHVAGVLEDGRLSIFVNGVWGRTVNYAKSDPLATPLVIGNSLWQGFNGAIDEVRIWSTARTHEQIVQNKDRRLTGREPGLAAYLPFDEGRGLVARNFAPGGKNGRLVSNWGRNVVLPAGSGQRPPKWVKGAPLESPPVKRLRKRR